MDFIEAFITTEIPIAGHTTERLTRLFKGPISNASKRPLTDHTSCSTTDSINGIILNQISLPITLSIRNF